jgi:hypothetical protein
VAEVHSLVEALVEVLASVEKVVTPEKEEWVMEKVNPNLL